MILCIASELLIASGYCDQRYEKKKSGIAEKFFKTIHQIAGDNYSTPPEAPLSCLVVSSHLSSASTTQPGKD